VGQAAAAAADDNEWTWGGARSDKKGTNNREGRALRLTPVSFLFPNAAYGFESTYLGTLGGAEVERPGAPAKEADHGIEVPKPVLEKGKEAEKEEEEEVVVEVVVEEEEEEEGWGGGGGLRQQYRPVGESMKEIYFRTPALLDGYLQRMTPST